jgi:hypothetical protein
MTREDIWNFLHNSAMDRAWKSRRTMAYDPRTYKLFPVPMKLDKSHVGRKVVSNDGLRGTLIGNDSTGAFANLIRLDGTDPERGWTCTDPRSNASLAGAKIGDTNLWFIGDYSLIEPNMNMQELEVGDLVVSTGGNFRRILAVLQRNGELTTYVVSDYNDTPDHEDLKDAENVVTAHQLVEWKYKPNVPASIVPVKMTVAEVAAKLGHEVEIVK